MDENESNPWYINMASKALKALRKILKSLKTIKHEFYLKSLKCLQCWKPKLKLITKHSLNCFQLLKKIIIDFFLLLSFSSLK